MLRDEIVKLTNDYLEQGIDFENEKQFQFELAWYLKEYIPGADIGFEAKVDIDGKPAYIDLVVIRENEAVPLELKRRTREQGAADEGGYGFFKDIHRLECAKDTDCSVRGKKVKLSKGLAIMITDFGSYYNGPSKEKCYLADFSLKDGNVITACKYNWDYKRLPAGYRKRPDIIIANDYRLKWYYAKENPKMAYLIVEIK